MSSQNTQILFYIWDYLYGILHDFLFENQPSQEVVTLQPIDDSFDEYEQNLGKNQVPDEDENQQDYRLTTL